MLLEAGEEITEDKLSNLKDYKIDEIVTLGIDHVNVGAYLRNTLAIDKNDSRESALMDIYRLMRPGEPPILETADALFHGLSSTKIDMISHQLGG